MRFGDLSNKIAPRVYIVFEGLVADVPADKQEEYIKLTSGRKTDWFKVMKCFKVSSLVVQRINWLVFSKDVNITIVSWLGPDAFYGIDMLLEKEQIISGLIWSTPDELAKEIITRPDVIAVYDPDPAHVLKYGGKGVWVRDVNDIGKLL